MNSASELSLFYWLTQWNVILWVIVVCSIIALAIFVERLVVLRQSRTDSRQLLSTLRAQLDKGERTAALQACEASDSSIGRVLCAGLRSPSKDKEDIEQAMELSGTVEIAKLEKNAKALSVIAHVAPLIGLLGTVVGFIQAFAEMRRSGMMDISASEIGAAMEYALETTAAGLLVAIPALLAYNFILSRIEGFVLDMQTSASELRDALTTSG